jgi:hypothetical protein
MLSDAPAFDDDPQSRLLTQVQGVIAEYEKAKMAERVAGNPGVATRSRSRRPNIKSALRVRIGPRAGT